MPVYVKYKHFVMQALYITIIYLGLYHYSKIYFKYVFCIIIIVLTIMFVDTLLTIRIFLRKYRKGIFLVRKHMFLNAWTRFSFSNFGFRCIWVLQSTYNWWQWCKCYSMLVTFVWWRLFGGGSWNLKVSKFDPVVHDLAVSASL